MLIGYGRISTADQDLAMQRDALTKAGCEKIYTDTMSGAKANRPGLLESLEFARKGDVLVVWRLDRLAATQAPDLGGADAAGVSRRRSQMFKMWRQSRGHFRNHPTKSRRFDPRLPRALGSCATHRPGEAVAFRPLRESAGFL